jgi:hypothetical protein
MKAMQRTLALGLTALLLLNSVPRVKACGPFFTEPIFVFEDSPDLPFDEFTNGKIGIVLPTFGRKTLTIAYRYLNGGSFTSDEQTELVAALKGKAPEDDGSAAVKEWLKTRKQILLDEKDLPEIYVERQHGEGYDFFPNCTRNAFEVATETLQDRAARYGPEDKSVRNWLAAQDTVFNNCSAGKQIPVELGAESPAWLRKDRDYQIAAAHFYSLDFAEARARFEKIAADVDSPWQEIAPYLVARTLVRQASLSRIEATRREFYERAETYLQNFMASGGKFTDAGRRLFALVKYNLHPEERVVELGRGLAAGNDENLRQDLIDYVWLLDKFETRIVKAEEERRHKLDPSYKEGKPYEWQNQEAKERAEQLQRGELIEINYYPPNQENNPTEKRSTSVTFKYDVTDAEIFATFERIFGRKLSDDEMSQLKQTHELQMKYRQYAVSPNRKWETEESSGHEDYYSDEVKLTFDLTPEFLRADDLSDWILTLQTEDPKGYRHAFRRWRDTGSSAWLAAALMKAEKSSPRVAELLRAAEKITRDEPSYATVAYHLVRLRIALGNVVAARKLLDDIISWQADVFPRSAQNQFLAQRMSLAENLSVFLKSAQRKPAAFYKYGSPGKISDLVKWQKRGWNPEYSQLSQEEYDQQVDREFADMLPWDDRYTFDGATVDILNEHFPLQLLAKTVRDPDLPDYLQGRLALAVWTRAILLNNEEVALKIAPDAMKAAPKMGAAFEAYLKARNRQERHETALFVLLKFPELSPLLYSVMPEFETSEELEYFFDTSWWCTPSDIDYDARGNEFKKVVPKPSFLTAAQLDVARREYRALVQVGDAKSYLGEQVIAWARSSPADPNVPEALFIAARANQAYKNGCSGWEHDDAVQQEAEKILKEHYPSSPWTAKLGASEKN